MGEGSLFEQLRGEVTWSSFTDAVDMSNSSSSPSTEERHSNPPGSEAEGDEGGPSQPRMRKHKNRDAARRSRKKQTERADQLHQELESLEASNSALRKEISSLEKTVLLYTTVLERHEPSCLLQGPGPGPGPGPGSTSCPGSAQASASTSAATPSASFGGRSPLTPAPRATPSELFSSGSSISSPHSSVMTAAAPHSLFFWAPPNPPPQTPCPGSLPQTPVDLLDEILIDSKPSQSHHSASSSGLFLSLLTIPSPPRAPPTSAGTSGGSLAQQSLLEDASRDLSFLELLEVNDWILQEPEMAPGFSEQSTSNGHGS